MPIAPPCHNQQAAKKASNWKHSKSTTQRGYGWTWQQLRLRVLKRDRYLCQPCIRQGKLSQAKEVDHKVEKAKGGTDDPDNLQAICVPCHRAKTSKGRGG